MTEQDFRCRLDAELSHVTWTQGNRYHVISRLNEGGSPVKKKFSTALVLAMVLMLLAASAVAATLLWKDAGERVAPLEAQNGYYDTWNTDAKLELVRALCDLGELEDDPDAQRLLTGDLTDEEKDALADQIMTAYVNGTADTVTLMSILEKLHGPMESWSMEDRVWYSGLLADNNMLTDETTRYTLPAGEELTQPQAVESAKAFLHGLGVENLDDASVEATMYEEPNDHWYGDMQIAYAGRRVWSIIFRKGEGRSWHVDLTANGAVILYDRPETSALYTTGLLPGDDAMTEERAIAIANEALAVSSAANAYYGYINIVDADAHAELGQRVWQVVYEDGSRVMLSFDGSVLYTEE